MSDYQRISVEQAQRLLATENTMLLDMRDPAPTARAMTRAPPASAS